VKTLFREDNNEYRGGRKGEGTWESIRNREQLQEK
jgi:hypothetical protein